MTLTLEEKRAKLAAGRPVRCEAHPLLKLRRHPFTIGAYNVARQDERDTSPVFRGTVGEQGEWVHGCRLCWLDEVEMVDREIQRRRRLAAWRGRAAEANTCAKREPLPFVVNAALASSCWFNANSSVAPGSWSGASSFYGDPFAAWLARGGPLGDGAQHLTAERATSLACRDSAEREINDWAGTAGLEWTR